MGLAKKIAPDFLSRRLVMWMVTVAKM